MIKYIYHRHHVKQEATYEDNDLESALRGAIHDFEFGMAAMESLTLADGTVLTEIGQVEERYLRLQEEEGAEGKEKES